ncbi:MAG: beta-ketoacyl synthase chain length factor [Pseudomonas sp.]|nr:beta-ketoacyl synthase chain length factor [Pseudomonas sp.]
MKFDIKGWQAWAPGISSHDEWLTWCAQPYVLEASTEAADVSFLPALQRRRLSPLARMVFHVGWPLADNMPAQPLVFCSRHGETARNLQLLTSLAHQENLSPTHFSLSVHNAVTGLWSIFRKDTSEMTSIAGVEDGLEHAVLEAQLLLSAGAPSVLLIIAEDQQPSVYLPWIDDVPFAYALALQIVPGQQWQLELSTAVNDKGDDTKSWPHALQLLPLLLGVKDQLLLRTAQRQWNWRRSVNE